MSRKGLIFDRLSTVWANLEPEQRIEWHFQASLLPRINESDQLITSNGWQYFVDVNTQLAVAGAAAMLEDPPQDHTPPTPPALTTNVWPLRSKLGTGESTRHPAPYVTYVGSYAATNIMIVTQTYDKFRGSHARLTVDPRISLITGENTAWLTTDDPAEYITLPPAWLPPNKKTTPNNNPRVRHVTIAQSGDTSPLPLDVPTGYFATTAGANRFASIKGQTARRRPDLPLGIARIISTTNGLRVDVTLGNPTGGQLSAISLPRPVP